MNRVILSPGYFPDPSIGRPVALGYIYIGEVDKDPEDFPIQASVQQEDGNIVQVAQPIRTNAGGVPTHNGSTVTILVDSNYSLRVRKSDLSQAYYVPSQSDLEIETNTSVTNMLGLVGIVGQLNNDTANMFGFFFSSPESQPKGGGGFVWQSDTDKATANGGIIIDPDNIGGFDGTVSTLASFIAAQGGGVGTGCWASVDDGPGDPSRYGLSTIGTSAGNAAAIQATIASSNVVVFPTKGATYSTDMVLISTDCDIWLNHVLLNGAGNAIFGVDTALSYLKFHDGKSRFPAASGTQGREFFINIEVDGVIGENTTGFPSGSVVNYFTIDDLLFENCDFAYSKVTVGGDGRTKAEGNLWEHDNQVATAPAYFNVTTNGDITPKVDDLWIKNNVFKVNPPDGSNVDILKITGGKRYADIEGNHIENLNTDCAAQVDVFTGGDRLRFHNNAMINTQLHRKQVIGSLAAAPEISYDAIMMNVFDLQDGFIQTTAAYFIGSLFTMAMNQFIAGDATKTYTMVHLDNSDTDYDDFATQSSIAYIEAMNICDLRGGAADSVFMTIDTADEPNGIAVINGNLQIGGARFIVGAPDSVAFVGNVWGDSGGATGTSINMGGNGVAVGNVADTITPVLDGVDSGNRITETVLAVDSTLDSTPDISVNNRILLSGAGTITQLDDGRIGQVVTIVAGLGGPTVAHGVNIRLGGSVNYVMVNRGSLVLKKTDSATWTEIGRMVP